MKKRTHIWRILVAVSVCLLLIAHPLLAQQAPATDQKPVKVYAEFTGDSTTYVPICSNGGLTLSFCKDKMLFRVEEIVETPAVAEETTEDDDLAEGEEPTPAGAVWYSAMTPETYSRLDRASRIWRAYMQSLVAITYAAKDETRGNTMNAYSADDRTDVSVKVCDDGLQFFIKFMEQRIAFYLEVALENGNLVVRIPADSIREDGEFALLSVEPLPFFGAVAKETDPDGYLVYPDGSGAITYFDQVADKNAYAQSVELDIYDTMDLEKTLNDEKPATAMLPIYGIKNNDTAVLAAITDGAENAQIVVNAAVESSPVPIHRTTFQMRYRNEYRIFLSSISGASSATDKEDNPFGVKYDADLQREDREVTYFLLRDEQADYSGMATVYRNYLLQKGLLKKNDTKEIGLFLTLFMGAEKEDAMVSPYVPMTTYGQAQEICKTLLDNGVTKLDVMLRGWSQGGYANYPQSVKPVNALGGKKELASLNAYVGASDNLTVCLENEFLYTNKNNYIAVKGTNVPITDEMEELFLLTPLRASKMLENAKKTLKNYKNLSMALPTMGSTLYPDYDRDFLSNRFSTVEVWKKIAADEKITATQGGNLYMLAEAEQLYDMPAASSLQQITDESIPWYYMIVHGCVNYTTTAGNRTGDLDMLKLKWLECGAFPYFELTYESPIKLYNTEYNNLFSSEFSQWKDRVIAVTKEMQTAMAPIADQSMVKHELLGEDQVCVTYENGYRVVINYSGEAFIFEDVTIAAKGYQVLAPTDSAA